MRGHPLSASPRGSTKVLLGSLNRPAKARPATTQAVSGRQLAAGSLVPPPRPSGSRFPQGPEASNIHLPPHRIKPVPRLKSVLPRHPLQSPPAAPAGTGLSQPPSLPFGRNLAPSSAEALENPFGTPQPSRPGSDHRFRSPSPPHQAWRPNPSLQLTRRQSPLTRLLPPLS
jgi:hypothetical protein